VARLLDWLILEFVDATHMLHVAYVPEGVEINVHCRGYLYLVLYLSL
jgi:hypothetical protein